jgi:hypothetical protein
MTVEADLLELRRMAAASSSESDGSLAALTSVEAVYAFLITATRSEGGDEGDVVELLCRFDGATAPEAREIAAVLGRLGYTVAASRLREIAGRRKHDLRLLK